MMSNVFNIERFATHDGPGIRTTVFFKGCPLHCPWCANPESWDLRPVLMHENRRCTKCGRCAAVCPVRAVTVEGTWQLNASRCIRCEKCAEACLNEAISFAGKEMETSDILTEVLKDRDYYSESGGGLTVSGGEPFLQAEALRQLLAQAKQAGLHTAVETTGCYDSALLKQADPLIDLYLFDFKHCDAEILRRVTGADREAVMENLCWLAEHQPQKVLVRMPVIPGFNDDRRTLACMMKTAADLGLKRVDLLPYHTLAAVKHSRMGTEYAWPYPDPLTAGQLAASAADGRAMGLSVTIGGQDRKEDGSC